MAKNYPQNIIIHHTAVSYNRNPDQYNATNNYHKSLGWGMIGYHYEIAKNGKLYNGRPEDMPGAHCYQQSMNYRSIGIALDGNFDQELPTAEQVKTLTDLLKRLMQKYNIPAERIYPHRKFALNKYGRPYKTCPGAKLSDNWGQSLIKEPIIEKSKIDLKFALKWRKKFILEAVDYNGKPGTGKLYYVDIRGRKTYIPPEMSIKEFVEKHRIATGFSERDVDRIPDA